MKKRFALIVICIMSIMLVGCGKSASEYNKKGMMFYESRDYDQAESYLAKAIELKPNNTRIASNYGMVLIQQGKVDEAIAQFEKLTTSKASRRDNKLGYRGLGLAYIQNKNYTAAIESFDKALEIKENPSWNTDIKYYKANACQLKGDRNAAIELYSDIIATDKENAAAYCARANVYRDMDEFALALADYNSALLYEEGNFEVYIGLAACYIDSGHQEEADEALFLASLLGIKTDEDKFYLGVVHYYQQNFESAKAEMEYALANGYKDAYFYLAEITLMQGDYKKALEYFNSYTASTIIESPTVCNDIGVCSIYIEDYETALTWIEKGLTFSNSSVSRELKRNQIACYENMGELSEAYMLLGFYTEEYPDDEAAKTDYQFLKIRVGGGEAEPTPTPAPDDTTTGDATDAPTDEPTDTPTPEPEV